MEETGRVLKIQGKTITIQGGELGGCFGCMNEECRVNGKVFTAENPRGLPLEIGKTVEVSIGSGETAANAVFVLVPPVALFVGAFLLTAVLAPASSEAARAAAGVVGLFAGFFGVYVLRRFKPAKAVPVVLRVVSDAQA
jgi:positive regulator of sigma E activity